MQPLIANTDFQWFCFLAQRAKVEGGCVDEVNFWRPKALTPIVHLEVGTPVFFRLKKPHFAIAGYGFYASFVSLRLELAWDFFGTGNGDPDPASFLQRIGKFRGVDLLRDATAPRNPLGCMLLRNAVFWPRERWIPWRNHEGWADNVVAGKREMDPVRRSRLLSEIQLDRTQTPDELCATPFRPLDVDEREIVLAKSRPRVGQGTFRSRLLHAYDRRCAITGEHTEIVLDAAHIQPYLGPRSNHLQNGLLLTKEFHALFDGGYVTVTPDYEVRVSPQLQTHWDNGHRYYPYDGQRLLVLPDQPSSLPSPEVLDWHSQRVFRQ